MPREILRNGRVRWRVVFGNGTLCSIMERSGVVRLEVAVSSYFLLPVLAGSLHLLAASTPSAQSQAFLKQWCQGCHQGTKPLGGFHVKELSGEASLRSEAERWTAAVRRIRNGEMPPKGAPAPPIDARETFVNSIETGLRQAACADGPQPGRTPVRRLNRDEYSATVRDLLNVNIDVGYALPADGAGGEGFDHTAETLFLSPIHAEKYLEAAKIALQFAATDARAKARIFRVRPRDGLSEAAAAQRILSAFLPRAYRRPIQPVETTRYMDLFRAARQSGESWESAVLFGLRGVLVSPQFLFRVEARPLDDFGLASRLSYFLWGSMPDELLWDIAAAGKLQDPAVLKAQIGRMLRSPRSTEFQRRFVEQWLRTRDLDRDKAPDPAFFPAWNEEEIRSDIKYQPVLFVREIFAKNLPVYDLIDSKWTIMNRTLAKLYQIPVQWRRDAARALYRVELPEGSDRGGLLGMPAVLAVSSYPNRTSPVLRGAWVLDSLLGTPPPPPPPGVPPLENAIASRPATIREKLTQHRANAVCASCHSRIDGIGFALENYDALGFWRNEEAGLPIDTAGELNDGIKFNGPRELKAMLKTRSDVFLRNLSSKMLGYALGRALTLEDTCTVDSIVEQVKGANGSSHALVEAIVFSAPFQSGARSQVR